MGSLATKLEGTSVCCCRSSNSAPVFFGLFEAGGETLNALLPLVSVNDIPIRFDTCIQVVANLKHFVKISAL